MIASFSSTIRHNITTRNRVISYDMLNSNIFSILFCSSFAISVVILLYMHDDLYNLWCSTITCTYNKSTTQPIILAAIWMLLLHIFRASYILSSIAFSTTKRRFVIHLYKSVLSAYVKKLHAIGIRKPYIEWKNVTALLIYAFVLKILLGTIFVTIMYFTAWNDLEKNVSFTSDELLHNIKMGFYVMLFAPLLEEILFRGLFVRLLVNGIHIKGFYAVYIFRKRLFALNNIGFSGFGENNRSYVAVIIITGILFGAVHVNSAVILLSCFGIILGWLRFATGSVWPCIMLHFMWNTLVFGGSLAFQLFG